MFFVLLHSEDGLLGKERKEHILRLAYFGVVVAFTTLQLSHSVQLKKKLNIIYVGVRISTSDNIGLNQRNYESNWGIPI